MGTPDPEGDRQARIGWTRPSAPFDPQGPDKSPWGSPLNSRRWTRSSLPARRGSCPRQPARRHSADSTRLDVALPFSPTSSVTPAGSSNPSLQELGDRRDRCRQSRVSTGADSSATSRRYSRRSRTLLRARAETLQPKLGRCRCCDSHRRMSINVTSRLSDRSGPHAPTANRWRASVRRVSRRLARSRRRGGEARRGSPRASSRCVVASCRRNSREWNGCAPCSTSTRHDRPHRAAAQRFEAELIADE